MTPSPCASGERAGVRGPLLPLLPLLLLLLLLTPPAAHAHKGSDAYWHLRAHDARLEGRLDVALRDLEPTLHFDTNADGALTWGEIRAREPQLREALSAALRITQATAPCPLTLGVLALVHHSDGTYLAVPTTAQCPAPVAEVLVHYALCFDDDAQHRALLSLSSEAGGHWVAFTANQRTQAVTFTTTSALAQTGLAFRQGVHHIAIGWDHLCFLFALLLPSVLRRVGPSWEPRAAFQPTLLEVTKVVTAFTVAHSLTLGLSAFEVVTPNAQWVEVAIALSVALAAFNNLVPFVPDTRWSLAFSLGLMHGFGFVSAIQDLGAEGPSLWLSVFGFNLGVEAGQLGIVAVFVPLAWAWRRRAAYPRVLLPLGSALILGLALYWTSQRL